MKLINTVCPHCGAPLRIDKNKKQALCEHCGATIPIDDEVQHIQYDNAEEAGYKFEKGRQRAQAEMAGNTYVNNRNTKQYLPKKKRRTWLWVIGWIFIFPIPLTILLLRKKDMKPVLKYSIIAASWIVYIMIGSFRGDSDKNKVHESNEIASIAETISTDENQTDRLSDSHTEESNSEHTDEITETASKEPNSEPMNEITETASEESTAKSKDKISILRAFYDDFSANGTLDNLKDMVAKYGLHTDHRMDGLGHDTYKVAYTEDLAKVVSNSDFTTPGNYVVIKFNLLGGDTVESITLHTDADDVIDDTPSGPTEMNSLLELFASLETTTTREEIDEYITENELVKYAFTHDSAYEIGFEKSAIRTRGRDREGEAVDISFVTSGDVDRIGMVSSASYAVHTGSSTHYALKFEGGTFYYEGEACENGMDAVQKYLDSNNASSGNDKDKMIDTFVNKFNAVCETQLEFEEDFTPSDTESGHYRTEFRLQAYKDAIGKSYAFDDATVDIVFKKPMFGDGNIRLYMDGATFDQCKEVLTISAPIMDETATDEDVQEAVEYISERKEANGYYFANLGLILLGNDNKGYELMLKMGND